MARTPAADSARSDFFICLDDQPSLDFGGKRFDDGQGGGAFGRVVKGMDVVRGIQQQPVEKQSADTADHDYAHVPASVGRIFRPGAGAAHMKRTVFVVLAILTLAGGQPRADVAPARRRRHTSRPWRSS